MISIRRYTENDKDTWNQFNTSSKNSLFMFNREFMDYHKDRFQDHSLMFYDDDELVAILPQNEKNEVLYSHGGLTYGGFITGQKMKQHIMNDCFDALISYSKENHFKQIIYKLIPHIFHTQPSEEDKYSLFLNRASLYKLEPSTTLKLGGGSIKMAKGRKSQISRARRENVVIQELTEDADFHRFIQLENDVLSKHHNTRAVHTGEELVLLHRRFPSQIHLFGAIKDNALIAGSVIFEYGQVVHTQYMAANDWARQIGALDLTINTIIEKYTPDKKWLDFGISTEANGTYLNEGLISQKEGFGGRTVAYETYLLSIPE